MSQVANISPKPRLVGPMLIWLVVIMAGAAVAMFATGAVEPFGKVAVSLAIPALISLLLLPALHQTWSQVVLLALWTGFAVTATLLGGLSQLAITFLCIPAIAMLFTRERVIEALVLAALGLIATLLSMSLIGLGGSPLSESGTDFLIMLGTAGTLSLIIATMIAGAQTGGSGNAASAATNFGRWGDSVVGGVFRFGTDDRLVDANREGHEQFGLDQLSEDILLGDIAGGGEASVRIRDAADMARRNNMSNVTRVSVPNAAGTKTSYDINITPTAQGELLVHALDRTNDAAQLEALRQSQTVAEREAREKTLFFAGVSHELRTPLNAIIGFSDMMRSRLFGPLPGKYAEYADLIHDSGQYMLDLIGDVLDLSKVEAGKYTLLPDTFDIADVVRSSVKMIRPSADSAEVTIDINVPQDDALLITADRKAARQILLNLLSNAVKFSPQGGIVRVSAEDVDGVVCLSVVDEGPGMSADDITRIGEPFAQGSSAQSVDARGSGLGLSLVKTLAELHDGRLDIRSDMGDGTVARVYLPSLNS
ncbi:MAG: sensor histidine kinase [Litorimonas sp.]